VSCSLGMCGGGSAGTVTLGGTLLPVLLGKRHVAHPPWSCPLNRFTVPVDEFPPAHSLDSAKVKKERKEAGQKIARFQDCGLGSFCETATNFVAEIHIDDRRYLLSRK